MYKFKVLIIERNLYRCSEALSKALSALYAKLLVVLGLAFPVTEVIANGVPDAYYQVLHYNLEIIILFYTLYLNLYVFYFYFRVFICICI